MTPGIPTEDLPSSSPPDPSRTPSVCREEPRILVIDDNEPTARALGSLLANAQYKTAIFHRGHDALEYARQHPCLAAVVDIHLPDMNGVLLAQQLRDRFGPLTPVVLLSGDTSMPTLNAVSKAGATHFFSKPVSASHLLERLTHWIVNSRNHGGEGQNAVYCDGHVEFQQSPFCGATKQEVKSRNNLYTVGGPSDKKPGEGVVGEPAMPWDSVLLPTDEPAKPAGEKPAPQPAGRPKG